MRKSWERNNSPNQPKSSAKGNVIVPNEWFVEFYHTLSEYNFTVDENTSYDIELSIDPEMLGRIFENLLAEINPETGEFAGSDIKSQTEQSLKNVKAILEEAGLTMQNVVKTTVFLADMADFAAMNEVYSSYFSEPYPARSAVAVKTLPKAALVEIECVAAK